MAVNLSPVGGVAAQFFTNSGVILSGGKIYTYAAGTTTNQTTYTSSNGGTAHSNPIILDSAGRVPSGEIWLTDGLQYKFVLKDANDVLIGTYDNIIGINSNFVNFTNEQEIQTATAGQTVFTLTTMQYQPATGSLSVFVDGVNQYGPGAQYAYIETSSTVVTFISGLHVGASVKFTTSAINASSYGTAFDISYTPPFTSSVATNVGDKLAQTVSVKDFGAVGDGTTDDTAAIQAAIDSIPLSVGGVGGPNSPAAQGGWNLYFPTGVYYISNTLTVGSRRMSMHGTGMIGSNSSMIKMNPAYPNVNMVDYSTGSLDTLSIYGLEFWGAGAATGTGNALTLGRSSQTCFDSQIKNCWFTAIPNACIYMDYCADMTVAHCGIENAKYGIYINNIGISSGDINKFNDNTFYALTLAGVYVNAGTNLLINDNQFDACGSANDTTGAIVLNHTGANAVRATAIQNNMFRANYNDIVSNGNGGSYSANTGVNVVNIVGNTSMLAYRRFAYFTDTNQASFTDNLVDTCNQSGLSIAAIDINGTSNGSYFSGNKTPNAVPAPLAATYGLTLGAATVNSVIGDNAFAGTAGSINIDAGATYTNTAPLTGTWTPTIGGTATYTIQEGFYTKTGNQVFIKGKIVINVIGTGSTNVISGLPFVAQSATNGSLGAGSVYFFSGLATSVTTLVPFVTNGASTIQFSGLTAAAATMSSAVTVFGSGTRIDFVLTYLSAT